MHLDRRRSARACMPALAPLVAAVGARSAAIAASAKARQNDVRRIGQKEKKPPAPLPWPAPLQERRQQLPVGTRARRKPTASLTFDRARPSQAGRAGEVWRRININDRGPLCLMVWVGTAIRQVAISSLVRPWKMR